jgi:hypothetical protein
MHFFYPQTKKPGMLTGFQSVSAFLAFFIIWTLVNFKRGCIPKDAISYYVILKKNYMVSKGMSRKKGLIQRMNPFEK